MLANISDTYTHEHPKIKCLQHLTVI